MTEREFTELPGLTVEFLPNSHRYSLIRGDEKVAATSPTTWLNIIDKGEAYVRWRGRLGNEQADLEAEQGRNRGTVLHRIMQEYCETGLVPRLSDFDPEWKPWIAGVCSWLLEAAPEPILTEQTVACWDLKLAGRFDLLALIDGKATVCDLKSRPTPKDMRWPPRISEQDHLQIAAYRFLLSETFPEHATEHGLIVAVDGAARVRALPCAATWEQSKKILDAFRAVREVQTSMKLLEDAPVREAGKVQEALKL